MNYLHFLFVLHLIALMAFNVAVVRPLNSNETWIPCNDTIGQISINNLCKRKEFEIGFRNVRVKCWMEFDNACPSNTKLIVLTMARRDGFEKRMGIRQTWMNDSIAGEVIRFLVADSSPGEADTVQQKLADEQKEHGDLVFLHGFVDIYSHIHFKWYGGLQWQQLFCADAEWVMKADDDSVVHLRRLAYWTEKKFSQIAVQNPLVYIGYIYYGFSPIRNQNSKWYISKDVYPLDWYPDFMQGTVYLATPATISAILSHSHEIVGFYLDDVVFTGILAELANVTLSDQKQHFIWGTKYDEKNGNCEDGVPTALSMWGAKSLSDFEHHYARLKAVKCKNN